MSEARNYVKTFTGTITFSEGVEYDFQFYHDRNDDEGVLRLEIGCVDATVEEWKAKAEWFVASRLFDDLKEVVDAQQITGALLADPEDPEKAVEAFRALLARAPKVSLTDAQQRQTRRLAGMVRELVALGEKFMTKPPAAPRKPGTRARRGRK